MANVNDNISVKRIYEEADFLMITELASSDCLRKVFHGGEISFSEFQEKVFEGDSAFG